MFFTITHIKAAGKNVMSWKEDEIIGERKNNY